MRQVFLIARQEFIKYVTRRGFLLSILMFPLWIMIVVLVPKWTGGGQEQKPHHVFTVLDRDGGAYDNAIAAALARRAGQAWRSGGAAAMPPWIYRRPPPRLADAGDDRLPAAIGAALARGDAPGALDTVIVVPAGFGARGQGAAQIWSESRDSEFRDFVSDALAQALRLKAVRQVAPAADPALLDVSVDVQARDPAPAGGRDHVVDSIVPVALAIILFVVSVMNSSVLLQGVVEEKSTRMIEVLLSCATAREITTGKLIGVIAVALTTLLIWALILLVLMNLVSHDTATLVFASLRSAASLQALPLLLVYFLCGLLIYGSLFLAIGSMASSLADAQALLGPSMLILMLPNLMISAVIRDPNGTLAGTLSWVPVYTPFFMMLRIASHPPVWQIWGTLALAVVTTVLMILWSGRVFARHVLTTERPPSLGALLSRFVGKRS